CTYSWPYQRDLDVSTDAPHFIVVMGDVAWRRRGRQQATAAQGSRRRRGSAFAEFAHDGVQRGLGFEPDPRDVRQPDVAVLHANPVSETAEWLEHVRIGFVTAQVQAGGDVQRH